MNRIEQIVGRGVRNSSHKNLEFEKRNVELFIYGTILENSEEESADLYVYRLAEYKAIQMGRVSRLLKETSVDCLINHDQTNFTQENIEANTKNDVKQILSNGIVIDDFKVGDVPYSAACDYMAECEYKCTPDKPLLEENAREDTYNETFIMMNSEKIFQKIRKLFSDKIDGKFFYKKTDLIHRINTPKPYPVVQIYAALTQMIDDANEPIMDKYGRTGHLINIGDYYLFQPSELNNNGVSIFERSVPLDFKHSMIKFDIKPDLAKEQEHVASAVERKLKTTNKPKLVLDEGEEEKKHEKEQKHQLESEPEEASREEPKIMKEINNEYELALSFARTAENVPRGDDNWYKHCGVTMRKIVKMGIMTSAETLQFLVEHLVDTLLFNEKVNLMNYIYSFDELEEN
jgi:hypothetical protein